MGAITAESNDLALPLHIQLVSRLTNLSVDTIRAWEKRYAAINPKRGRGRHRLFSSDDVARLMLLKQAVDSGASISRVAPLATSELRFLIERERIVGDVNDAAISKLIADVRSFDAAGLVSDLATVSLTRSTVEFADDIIAPLMAEITAVARDVEESTAHQLLLCECIRSISSLLFSKYGHHRSAPAFISFTLPGDRHAVPALLAALVSAEAGYRGLFAGTEISPRHVETLARSMRAAGVGVYVGMQSHDALQLLNDVRKRLPHLPVYLGSHLWTTTHDWRPTQTLREFISLLRPPSLGHG